MRSCRKFYFSSILIFFLGDFVKKRLLGLSFSFVILLGLFLLQTNVLKGFHSDLNLAYKCETIGKDLPFVLVVTQDENDCDLERNLFSIKNQTYKNFRVIFIGDDTYLSRLKNLQDSIQSINPITISYQNIHEKYGILGALYQTIQNLKNDEVVYLLNTQESLKTDLVLSNLNSYYQNSDLWVTYSQDGSEVDSKMKARAFKKSHLKHMNFRKDRSLLTRINTFYAGIFKKIKLDDLLENGSFIKDSKELAIALPILEMSREHIYFVNEELVINKRCENEINGLIQTKSASERIVCGKNKYLPLNIDPRSEVQAEETDILIFSYNRPLQLYALLESLEKHASGFRKIGVIYRDDPEYESGYRMVKNRFSDISFFQQSKTSPKKDFKPLVMDFTFGDFGKGASYIAYAVDDIIITDEIDFKKGVEKLKQTSAYGLYYRLGRHTDYCYAIDQYQGVPDLVDVSDNYYVWQFSTGKGDWNYPNSVDLVLYKKDDLHDLFTKIKFTFPNDFEGEWAKYADANKIGLCYERAKMVNIPMNIVSTFNNRFINSYSAEELNLMFLKGLKIDIEPFYHIMNRGAHADISPQFIQRDE
jgi:hypothetical protein